MKTITKITELITTANGIEVVINKEGEDRFSSEVTSISFGVYQNINVQLILQMAELVKHLSTYISVKSCYDHGSYEEGWECQKCKVPVEEKVPEI